MVRHTLLHMPFLNKKYLRKFKSVYFLLLASATYVYVGVLFYVCMCVHTCLPVLLCVSLQSSFLTFALQSSCFHPFSDIHPSIHHFMDRSPAHHRATYRRIKTNNHTHSHSLLWAI
uniref:Uncharacterized protein n=1 Tax=Mastacembelus armatus TaxID=205130 RepID=A0A7N8XBT0_9TELE